MEAPQTFINPDQLFVATYPDKKIALLISTDGTTTQRGERVGSKTTTGASIQDVEKEIETFACENCPDLVGYRFIHLMVLTYPNKILHTQNDDKETEKMINFCVGVNYKLIRRNITTENRYGLDGAMITCDLCYAVVDVTDHPDQYEWDKNILAEAWARQHREARYLPFINLTDSAATKYRDSLIESLKDMPNRYAVKKWIDPFIIEHNIPIKLNANKQAKIDAIVQYIKDNYPPQIVYPKVPKIVQGKIVYV